MDILAAQGFIIIRAVAFAKLLILQRVKETSFRTFVNPVAGNLNVGVKPHGK